MDEDDQSHSLAAHHHPLEDFEWADEDSDSPEEGEFRSIPMRIIPQAEAYDEARSGSNTPETGRGSPVGNGPANASASASASSESAARFLSMAPSDLADAFSKMATASLGSSFDSLPGTKRQRENGLGFGSGVPGVYYDDPATATNRPAEREAWLGGPPAAAAHSHPDPVFRGQGHAFAPAGWDPTGPTEGSLIAPTVVKMEEQDDHGDLSIRRQMLGQGPV